MRILNTLYVTDHRARIGLKKANLLVTTPETSTRVPIESLDAVTLLGNGQISTQALTSCTDRGIRVAALTQTGRLRFTVGPPVGGNVLLRVAQHRAAANPDEVAAISRCIVAAKLQNYRRLIVRWSWDAAPPERSVLLYHRDVIDQRIQGLVGTVDGDRIRGIEGDGTRRYFRCLGAHIENSGSLLRFGVRSRRPPRDEANSLLSFLYGLLLTEIVGALDGVGLDPQVGFLHGLRPGRPSLALDLIEEFRPSLCDRLAVGLITRRELRREHFSSTSNGACYLTDNGRHAVLQAYEAAKESLVRHSLLRRDVPRWSLPTVQATLLARYLRGDLPGYPPFLMAS